MKNVAFLLQKVLLAGGVVFASIALQPATAKALPDIECTWYQIICCTVCESEGEIIGFNCEGGIDFDC